MRSLIGIEMNEDVLIDADVVSGPLEEISIEEVRAAIHKMKNDKSTGPTVVAAEMLKASGESGVRWMTDVLSAVVEKRIYRRIGARAGW